MISLVPTLRNAILVVSLLCCCSGCHHNAHPTFPERVAHPQEPGRRSSPKLTILTNNQAAIQYQWAFTNMPDGTKMLRFSPGQ